MTNPLAAPARRALLIALALATLASAALASRADAQFLPAVLYGGGLKSGQKVEALIDGKVCASTTASAQGEWVMQVPADAPCGPKPGSAILFRVDGALAAPAPAAEWQSGGIPSANVAKGYTLFVDEATKPPATTTDGSDESDDGGSSSAPLIVGGAVAGLAVLAAGASLVLRRRSAG